MSSETILQKIHQAQRPLVMAILNVTPDSFYDGGKNATLDAALRQVEQFIVEGADVIDIGGESTRPGAKPLSLQQECERVLPVIEAIHAHFSIPISIDTYKPVMMQYAVEAGATLINDIHGLEDALSREMVAKLKVPACLMHMQGTPAHMQDAPCYSIGVVPSILNFFQERLSLCFQSGIQAEQLILDPGIGFGKTLQNNLDILRHLSRFKDLGYPLLIGASRKQLIGDILGKPVNERLYGSLGIAAFATLSGVSIIRVHDVLATRECVQMINAIIQHPAERFAGCGD